jgi:hypothetical protein
MTTFVFIVFALVLWRPLATIGGFIAALVVGILINLHGAFRWLMGGPFRNRKTLIARYVVTNDGDLQEIV